MEDPMFQSWDHSVDPAWVPGTSLVILRAPRHSQSEHSEGWPTLCLLLQMELSLTGS